MHTAECLEGLAGVAVTMQQPREAARLFGAADCLREALQAPIPPGQHPAYEDRVATARARLDDAAWEAAWAEGRAMAPEQAVADALERAGGPADARPTVNIPLPAG